MKRIILLVALIPVFIIGFFLFSIKYILSIVFMPKEAWRLAIAFDSLCNAVFGGNHTQTISERAGKAKEESLTACVLCKFLDLFDKDHCEKMKK